MTAAQAPKKKPTRRRSGTASWHMSREAVDTSVLDYASWSPEKCLRFLAIVRWGSFELVICPHCGTQAKHTRKRSDPRWKCLGCRSRFSVTSGTPWAARKLEMRTLLSLTHLFECGAAGQPALEVRRMLGLAGYNTAYVNQAKLKEATRKVYNRGFVNGVVEIDGVHMSGYRADEKRGRPQVVTRDIADEAKRDETTLTQRGQQDKKKARGARDPDFGGSYHPLRRIGNVIRQRSGIKGKGALNTRIFVSMTENAVTAMAGIEQFVASAETVLATDTASAYRGLGKHFKAHQQVNHNVELSGPNGEHTNFAESLNARQDRAERNYTHSEPKNALDNLVDVGFRDDHRRLAPGEVVKRRLKCLLSAGLSTDFRGFTHGKHRETELLLPAPRPVKAAGPKKGRKPISSMNGWAPR